MSVNELYFGQIFVRNMQTVSYWSSAHVTWPIGFVDIGGCRDADRGVYASVCVWHLPHGANLRAASRQRRTRERRKESVSRCKQLSWRPVCSELSHPDSRR